MDASHCTLTIDASQSMGPVRGLVMTPFLRKLFYGINFKPFIDEAERRATTHREGIRNPRVVIMRRSTLRFVRERPCCGSRP